MSDSFQAYSLHWSSRSDQESPHWVTQKTKKKGWTKSEFFRSSKDMLKTIIIFPVCQWRPARLHLSSFGWKQKVKKNQQNCFYISIKKSHYVTKKIGLGIKFCPPGQALRNVQNIFVSNAQSVKDCSPKKTGRKAKLNFQFHKHLLIFKK